MVRNIDDLDFCLSSHPQSILEGLRSLCSQPKLVDVTLSAGGRDFPCHRAILALCSHYFHSMFSGDFVESIAARVELHDVDPNVLSSLLDFAYTGKLTINKNNVEGLICTSSQLQFHTVRSVCSRYLQHQIDATNCLGILEFGEIHGCPEVVAKAWSFLLENFEAVQQHEEFLMLDKDRLVACLKDEDLHIRDYRSCVEAVLAWVGHCRDNRICHLLELLGLAKLSLLTESYLTEKLLKEPLVQDSLQSKEFVERICREKREKTGCESEQRVTEKTLNLQEVLFVMGGRSLDDDSDDEDEDEAEDSDRRLYPRNCGYYNPKLGGSRGSQSNTWSTTETWKYITREGKWVTIAPMLRPRTNHSSATLNGEIYVIGGTTMEIVEVEHYDPFSNCWTLTGPALKYVTNFTAISCEGKLYLIGSCAVKYNALTMQCYNPVIDSWCIICSPFIPKYLSSPRSVSMDGVIYLVADNTKKVYLYNPEGNMWEKIQFLHTLHENGDLVVLGGQLYVTGGHWKGMEGDYGVEVEAYNRASNTWKVECFLPRLWTYSGCCSIFLDTSQWSEVFPDET
uniref:Kelch-like protein n=2 Tax=Carassius TaxID=7956 RepID=A0A9E8AG20_CARAU|nr:kelch-like protein [Carassius auratus]UZH44930.1 kelch-like protein [Carassius gibelio]WEX30219.1 Kelch-like protein 30-A [Carassius auratus]WEX30316.1 Kelch-like protein 30-A [Carassius gibelio]